MKLLTTLLITILFTTVGFNSLAQDQIIYQPKPIIDIRGDETPDLTNIEIIETSNSPVFGPVFSSQFIFDVHNITDRKTGYDLQSNASTQQVWLDYNNPDFLHAFFTNSQQSVGYTDRTCLYFGSTDAGVTWFELGQVPTTGRAGFPSIYGTTSGSAVLLDHNNFFGGFTHTTVGVDNSPFEYNIAQYDPTNISDGPVWPRHTVTDNGIVIFASSGSPVPDDQLWLNTLNIATGTFSGWQTIPSDDAESYDFSISPNGKIGLAFLGDPPDDGDVFYRESTDDGITWSSPTKVFDRNDAQDTTMGGIRGVQINYYNEEPCITYEICQQIFSSGNFFPGLPSEIHFWSPNVNGGNPLVIADSSNVPFYPYVGTNDVHVPLCRPVIGRLDDGYLFIAFNATTEHLFPSADTTSYMAGYFMMSGDGGATWSVPEKFTPEGPPLLDWRYPSIAEVSPLGVSTVHIVMQGDTLPGSTVNTGGMPVGVTAQYYHFSTEILLPSVDGIDGLITEYVLGQNFPNPFNPSTKIKYSIPASSFAQLRVYDVLGNEVALLVDEEKPAGTYEVEFDALNIPSGVYFYTLQSGEFNQTKKMILMK
jgi:hypothetical protein